MTSDPQDNAEDQFDVDDAAFDDAMDSDFDSFETETGGSSQSPLVKLGIIGGIVVVIIGAIFIFGGSSEPVNPSVVGGARTDLREPVGTAELDPSMQEALQELNDQQQAQAEDTGTSFLPTPIDTSRDRMEAQPLEAAQEDPLDKWREIQEQQQAQIVAQQQTVQPMQQGPSPEEQARAQALNDLAQAMSKQMSEIIGSRQIKNLSTMTVTSFDNSGMPVDANKETGLSYGGMMGADGYPMPMQQTVTQLLPAGTVEYGQMLIEANSDINGPVLAQIVTGPFAGGRVIGSFSREDEYLVIKFNTVVSEGISYSIDAVAVDPDNNLTGMATDVDRRYWERVILPAAARFIEGMGSAIADSGSTTVTVSGDTVVEQGNDLDTREELYKGVEEAAQQMGDVLEQEGNETEIQVRVRAGTPVGILFLKPVFDNSANTGLVDQNQGGFYNMYGTNGQFPYMPYGGLPTGATGTTGTTGYPAGTVTGGYPMQQGAGYYPYGLPQGGYPYMPGMPNVINSQNVTPTTGTTTTTTTTSQ
ncbi:MAG: DotG/IcmE/VirB10 family protein [Pseudobdellovibrionaceae bacterium]